jgi:hypothetical protein
MKNSAVTTVPGMIQPTGQTEARCGVAEQHQRAEKKCEDAARRQDAVRRRKIRLVMNNAIASPINTRPVTLTGRMADM